MSILSRIKAIFLAGANHAAAELEDPRASLNYSLVRLEGTRVQVSRSMVEVAAARERMADQCRQQEGVIERYIVQAQSAAGAGREDLARVALQRKEAAEERRAGLGLSLAGLDRQLESLKETQSGLDQKIALFHARKEELAAIYDASRAQVQVQEALTGISKDVADVGHTIRRAEERIQQMRSRASAIQGLMDQGYLEDVLSPGQDDIDRELAWINSNRAVEDELSTLKQISQQQPKLLTEDNKDDL